MQFKVIKKQNNSDMCIVCGLESDASLKTRFYELENGFLVGITTPLDIHQSYPNRMHGGMITSLLDEVLGRAVQVGKGEDIWAVTGELTTKFRKPVPLNEPIKCVAKITRENAKFYIAEGFIENEKGELLAQAKGTYFKAHIDDISEGFLSGHNWFYSPDEKSLEYIDIINFNFFDKQKNRC